MNFNLDGVSKGDSLIINEQGNPAWGSAAFIPTFENLILMEHLLQLNLIK